jgi:hypothetical protein
MSITLNATFNLPVELLQQLLPHINHQSIEIIHDDKEEKLKLFLIGLYLHCHKSDKSSCAQLWQCVNSHSIISDFLTFLQQTSNETIINFIKTKVSDKVYASIIEDDDFYVKLIDLLVEEEEIEQMDQKELDDVINTYKSSNPMLDLLDDEKFDQYLSKMGINEEGRQKAKEIKQEMIQTGKPDMTKVMSFISEYKQNFDASNVDLNTLYSMMTGATGVQGATGNDSKTEEKPQLPFDLNNMMSMINTISSNFGQPKSRRGRRR